jgi:cadmium resistance protein CadD (predicted permease)
MTLLVRAVALFAATNLDDLVVLAVLFNRAGDDRRAERRVVFGQYVGFGATLAVALAAAAGASLLPEGVVAYAGLVPIAIGLREAWEAWHAHRGVEEGAIELRSLSIAAVAAVTFANGGDNIGVYVPVFTAEGAGATVGYSLVFVVLVALWCGVGRAVANHPVVERTLTRWGHVLVPVVLITIGVAVLVEGGAFGLG